MNRQNIRTFPRRRAIALLNAGRGQEAVDDPAQGLEQQPGDLRMSFMLAQAQRDSGDLDGAEATARSAGGASRRQPRATYLLAQMLQASERTRMSWISLKPRDCPVAAVSGKGPRSRCCSAVEGLALQQLHKNDEAIDALQGGHHARAGRTGPLRPADPGVRDGQADKEGIEAAEQARRKFPKTRRSCTPSDRPTTRPGGRPTPRPPSGR